MTANNWEEFLQEEDVPTSAGLSSFNLLDVDRLFEELDLAPGMTLLDLACGVGNYSVAASPKIGRKGRIYALDLWEEGIETLEVRAAISELENIRPLVCDAAAPLPLSDGIIDLCLMATMVHIMVREQKLGQILGEVKRVMKRKGTIAVVEFHKKEGPPGPPLAWRLAPEELHRFFGSFGYQCSGAVDVGLHNYLALYRQQS